MNISRLCSKTFIMFLCCILILGTIGVSQSAWLTTAWNYVTGAKDTLEGIQAIIDALQTDIDEAHAEIKRRTEMKYIRLQLRNKIKREILPAEQEQSAAEKLASDAHKEYHDAMARANTLRDEIADLTDELRWVSLDDPRHDEILASLAEKNSSLSAAEDEKSAARNTYYAEKNKSIRIWDELKGPRDIIAEHTKWIKVHEDVITELDEKILDLQAKIAAEKERYKQVEEGTVEEEKEWEELEKQSKEPQI